MSKSRKISKSNHHKRDLFYGLGVRHDYIIQEEAFAVVVDLVESIRDDLYSSSRDMRAHVYFELLRETAELMDIDGGPTFALKMFRRMMEYVETLENERGRKVIGPFLTKEGLEAQRRNHRPRLEVPNPEVGNSTPEAQRAVEGYCRHDGRPGLWPPPLSTTAR